MNRNIYRTLFTLVALAVPVLLALLGPARAWAHGPADGGASTESINDLFTVIFWIAVPVFLLVEGLVLYAIWSSHRRRKDASEPDQIEGSRPLEIGWTVLSFVIIGIVFILGYRFMSTEYRVEADQEETTPDLTVHVTGYMFNWDFKYFLNDGTGPNDDTGITTTRRMTIPAQRNVLLEITSDDVVHSFWVPELAGKIDAVPGYVNTMWLNVKEPGLYEGNCAEYCGTLHWNMLIETQALPPDEFDMWIAEQRAAAEQAGAAIGQDLTTPLPQGDAAAGEAQFHELGCDSCHAQQPGAGPSLAQIAEHAQQQAGTADYETPQDYLRESILVPCAYTYEGYNCQVMPGNYGERLTAQQLADMIAYLESYE